MGEEILELCRVDYLDALSNLSSSLEGEGEEGKEGGGGEKNLTYVSVILIFPCQ